LLSRFLASLGYLSFIALSDNYYFLLLIFLTTGIGKGSAAAVAIPLLIDGALLTALGFYTRIFMLLSIIYFGSLISGFAPPPEV